MRWTPTYKGISFKLATIRKVFQEHGSKGGLRKFARASANQIQITATTRNIIGNLANKIKRNNPGMEFTKSQDVKIWMSDFQATNPNCPAEIRKLIVESFSSTKSLNTSKNKRTGK